MATNLYIFDHFEHIGKIFIFKNNRFSASLTLFCYIYNVFLLFLIDFFLLNSNPMSASFKYSGIFFKFKVKGQFQGQI